MRRKSNEVPEIHITKNTVIIKGTKMDLMSYLATIIQALKQESNLSESDIRFVVNLGLKDKQELRKETEKYLDKLIDDLFSNIVD